MIIQIDPKIILYGRKIQGLCYKKYHGHSKGCINIGKKRGCPMQHAPQPLINEVLDFNKEIFLIYTSFDVGIFAERMRRDHPQWEGKPREWYNPRRWQGTSRAAHNLEIEKILRDNNYNEQIEIVNKSPEAHGVNISELMLKATGIELNWTWPPVHDWQDNNNWKQNKVYQASIGGYINKNLDEKLLNNCNNIYNIESQIKDI